MQECICESWDFYAWFFFSLYAFFLLLRQPLFICVCVQDPGCSAQQALCGGCQVNRTCPSSAWSDCHPRLCRLHHGVCRQWPPIGAQSGAGIAWHPWQVGSPWTPPFSVLSSRLSLFSDLIDTRCWKSAQTLSVSRLFKKILFFNTNGRILTG